MQYTQKLKELKALKGGVKSMSDVKLERLQEHYRVAMELYRHEDDLNWRKLHNMFYVNAGLFAIVGFLVKVEDAEIIKILVNSDPVRVVAFIGAVVSIGFAVAIICGVHYMLNRKDTVTLIEDELYNHGLEKIVSRSYRQGFWNRLYRISWTTYMLRVMPVVFFLAWIVVLFVPLFCTSSR